MMVWGLKVFVNSGNCSKLQWFGILKVSLLNGNSGKRASGLRGNDGKGKRKRKHGKCMQVPSRTDFT